MGFGNSVVQRLCKTSVKKNLYWEIKEKVIEESFNGVRTVRRPQRVRVYGTDSTREVRARLIEILYDRVALHKDKFVAPILHAEMQSMEVKKNGKVEHSQNSHDDQVFSYLMALYVWYDGKNLAERYHIIKNTIKTDTEEEIEDLDFEDSLESVEKVDLESATYDPDSEIAQELEWIEKNSTLITSEDLKLNQYLETIQLRDQILASNQGARESYCRETGLDPSTFSSPHSTTFVSLPDEIFMDNDSGFDYEDQKPHSVLSGNLANWWDKV